MVPSGSLSSLVVFGGFDGSWWFLWFFGRSWWLLVVLGVFLWFLVVLDGA